MDPEKNLEQLFCIDWPLFPRVYLKKQNTGRYILLDWLTKGIIIHESGASLEECLEIAKEHLKSEWGTEDTEVKLLRGRARYLNQLPAQLRELKIQEMPECKEKDELLAYMVKLRLTS